MAKKHKPLEIYDDHFNTQYFVSYGVSYKRFKEAFVKKFGEAELIENVFGLTARIKDDGGEVYWIWTERKDVAVLAHEIFHATCMAMDFVGLHLCPESDEAYAYNISMLMRKVLGL